MIHLAFTSGEGEGTHLAESKEGKEGMDESGINGPWFIRGCWWPARSSFKMRSRALVVQPVALSPQSCDATKGPSGGVDPFTFFRVFWCGIPESIPAFRCVVHGDSIESGSKSRGERQMPERDGSYHNRFVVALPFSRFFGRFSCPNCAKKMETEGIVRGEARSVFLVK